MTAKRVLITGVSGSIGSSLAHYLSARNYDVYGTVRKKTGAVYALPPERLVEFDLSQNVPFDLPSGLDVVIHCAAATSEKVVNPHLSKKMNVDGTQRLIGSCRKSGVSRFIFISSMSANPNNPSSYAQTKLAAENVLKQLEDLDWVIIRPALVINPNGRGIYNKMLQYIRALPVIPIIGSNPNLSVVWIGDLCEAIMLSCEKDDAARKIIEVGTESELSLLQIVRLTARKLGKKPFCIVVPYPFALAVAALTSFLGRPLVTKDNVYGLRFARTPNTQNMRHTLGMRVPTINETLEHGKFD